MRSACILLALAALTGCDSRPVASKPHDHEITGVWVCSDFPSGFLAKAKVGPASPTSKIEIRKDGSCSASNMPQRDPYRFVDVSSSWTLTDPSMTPSGTWSVELGGNFLQCRRKGDDLELRYLISGMDEYSVTYQRTEQAGAQKP